MKHPEIINDAYCPRCEDFCTYEYIGLQGKHGRYVPIYNASCCGSTKSFRSIESELEAKLRADALADTEPMIRLDEVK